MHRIPRGSRFAVRSASHFRFALIIGKFAGSDRLRAPLIHAG